MVQDPSFRQMDAFALHAAFARTRQRTLAFLDDFMAALRDQSISANEFPYVNPPLWEFGHVAWFSEYWILRNPQRHRGTAYQPGHQPHTASLIANADQLYNSAVTDPNNRWHITLEPYKAVRHYLEQTDRQCRAQLLHDHPVTDQGLYFYRLALAHEMMHLDSFITTAQTIGFELSSLGDLAPDSAWENSNDLTGRDHTQHPTHHAHNAARPQIQLPAQQVVTSPGHREFSFDNELPNARWVIDAIEMDQKLVTHDQFAAFVRSGGYEDPAFWSEAGRQWLAASGVHAPAYWRQATQNDQTIERCWFGQWRAVDPSSPMIHVNLYEAQAWCKWAQRRLPTEAEWLAAAQMECIDWGSAWEWMSDAFEPFIGFQAHPYQDYSVPWFGDHQVLKGSSWMTAPELQDINYRNFFLPCRNDIPAGFRSVRLD
jgi:gamma-glutamyl hercynylcysteine S-oxide synthase